MPKLALIAATLIFLISATPTQAEAEDVNQEAAPAVLDFEINSLAGKPVDLAKEYRGKALLIVNVASRCGLTPQYEGLQALQEKYGEDGFAVLGFPCNQFGGQEPGTADQIQDFCKRNYGVTFDLFEKIDVNGEGAHELYQYLTELETKPQGPGKIGWNFEKFLVDRDGRVTARFGPRTKPDDAKLVAAIEAALATE